MQFCLFVGGEFLPEPQPFKALTIGRLNPLGYQMGLDESILFKYNLMQLLD